MLEASATLAAGTVEDRGDGLGIAAARLGDASAALAAAIAPVPTDRMAGRRPRVCSFPDHVSAHGRKRGWSVAWVLVALVGSAIFRIAVRPFFTILPVFGKHSGSLWRRRVHGQRRENVSEVDVTGQTLPAKAALELKQSGVRV